ncbi:MAG: hypothetical protein JNL82_18385 [Myxococcales bacterium]|nr:hypothetical protein [Myxococcales bacterium]
MAIESALRPLALLAACTPLACSPDPSGEATGDAGSSSSSSSSSSDAAPTTGVPEPASTGSTGSTGSTTDPGFDPPVPTCGNGYVEAGEECDDANAVEDDGCTSACVVPCGLAREHVELAPSALSEIGGVRVAAAADGGIVVFGNVRKISLDMEGNQDQDPRQGLVVAYDAAGDKRWERALGPVDGDLELAGGAVDGAGDVFIAGSIDGDDGVDIWVARLAAADGATLWTTTADGLLADSDDLAGGLALTAGGDPIVSGQVYDADQDSDVWLRKLGGADGATIWTTTWSGQMDNGFSVDAGGPVAVAPDDSVFVLAREYVDYTTSDATLLKFAADGGGPLWLASPRAGGGAHRHLPGALAVDPAGGPLFSIDRTGPAATFWLFKYEADGAPTWDLGLADFQTGDADTTLAGLGVSSDGDLLVGGTWENEDPVGEAAWTEIWLHRLDAAGVPRCRVSARGVGDDLVPPSLAAADLAGGPGGVALATGNRSENDEPSLWTGLFRPL